MDDNIFGWQDVVDILDVNEIEKLYKLEIIYCNDVCNKISESKNTGNRDKIIKDLKRIIQELIIEAVQIGINHNKFGRN